MMPLREENGFRPVFDDIPEDVKRKARICFLNYPNNPTGAHGDDALYEKAIDFAGKYEILICHDAAYSELTYDGYTAKSILEFDREKRYSIEFLSLSKTYCMTGWRVAFAVGNAEAIENLGKLKTNIDSGVFLAIQEAAVTALSGSQDCVREMKEIFAKEARPGRGRPLPPQASGCASRAPRSTYGRTSRKVTRRPHSPRC